MIHLWNEEIALTRVHFNHEPTEEQQVKVVENFRLSNPEYACRTLCTSVYKVT